MKYFLLYILFFCFLNLYSENLNIKGKWLLEQRLIKDYNDNYIYDDFNAYTQLKAKLLIKQCSPKINEYSEKIIVEFNEDGTGLIPTLKTVQLL